MKLSTFPSTNARIAATILVFFGTAVRYLVYGVPPGTENAWFLWLTLMFAAMGVDATQFFLKRKTEIVLPPERMAQDVPDVVEADRGASDSAGVDIRRESTPDLRLAPTGLARDD